MKQIGIGMNKLFIIALLFSLKLCAEPIIFNTLPKSGSVYIGQTLSRGIKGNQFMRISHNTFPTDPIIEKDLRLLVQNDSLTQEHFDASPENLQLLKKICPKLVVHVRDPRQAMISFIHHLKAIRHSEITLKALLIPLPEDYFDWDFGRQLEWHIDNYFPHCVEWIQNWVRASEEEGLDILLTTYEEFVEDREAFFAKLLHFYHLENQSSLLPNLPHAAYLNFRSGKKDEWQQVMSLEQRIKVTEMIPRDLFIKFNWTP